MKDNSRMYDGDPRRTRGAGHNDNAPGHPRLFIKADHQWNAANRLLTHPKDDVEASENIASMLTKAHQRSFLQRRQ